MSRERYIIHVDMDAFFASVEQRDNPKLRGKPVIIGADPKQGTGRGVVSTCSYEARKFGVHSAMPISIAYRKCPQGIFLPPNMEKYSAVSEQIYDVFQEFTPKIEPVSIDEAFLDITGSFHLFNTPLQTAVAIKSRIKGQTKLTSSLGLAPTKMVAKIASDLDKPDGLVEVKPGNVLSFLWPLAVDKLWGLGKKTRLLLKEKGINTIGELAKYPIKDIENLLGNNGVYLWQLAQGVDNREVEMEGEIKSVSNEATFDRDTEDKNSIEHTLISLCEKVSRRLRIAQLKGRTVTLKIRLSGFQTHTRANTIHKATNFIDVIYKQIRNLYDNFELRGRKVRLLGVKVSNLLPEDVKDSLFLGDKDNKLESIHSAVDKIRAKFGDKVIYRAGSLKE